MNIQRIVLEFFSGFLFALVGYLPIIGFAFFISGLGLEVGRTTIILLALFLGYPMGSVLGILLVNKFFFKAIGWNVLAIGLSIALGVIGGGGGLMMMGMLGDYPSVIIPALIACSAVVGYNIASLFQRS